MLLLTFTTIVTIAFFIYTFLEMVKRNNSNYFYLILIEFIGILIIFIHIFNGANIKGITYILVYSLSIAVPIVIKIFEKKGIYLDEIFSVFKAKKEENIQKLLKIIEKKPESYFAHKALAEIYEDRKEYEKSADEYLRVIQLKENDYQAYINLANMLLKNNNKEQASEVLQRLLLIKPEYTDGTFLLGKIYYEEGKYKEAISIYNQALNYNPSNYYLYYNLGMVYTRLNNFENAKECYKKAAIINSLMDVSNLNEGQIYMIYKDYIKAEGYFSETIHSEDDKISAYSYYYLAKIRLIQNNKEQAIKYINIAIEIYPNIIKRVENDNLFIPILSQITKQEPKDIESKMKKEQEDIVEYLGNTFEVVETLTNDVANVKEIENKEIQR
jgi:tetratricopeptide (TPR) repeat protein